MEQKLNIAEILKNKPRGTKLYSMIHGKCSLEAVTDEIFKINFCTSKFGLTQSGECTLIKFGNMYDGGECIIFPSKEMRDWSKFQWEKGDVLISNDGGTEVIFDEWYDDTYTSFYCKHYLNSEDKNKIVYYEEFLCTTERYSLEDKDIAQTYINTIEKRLDGKLNLETLEIEKQPKYRPFANAEECWNEMQKHQPFGWIMSQNGEVNSLIIFIDNVGIVIGDRNNGVIGFVTATDLFKIKFADGTPFGIREE